MVIYKRSLPVELQAQASSAINGYFPWFKMQPRWILQIYVV